jgi:hypothetical protein
MVDLIVYSGLELSTTINLEDAREDDTTVAFFVASLSVNCSRRLAEQNDLA